MKTTAPVGVLAMAYGGPDSLAAVPGYLADVRSGRPTPRRVLEEITGHYRRIGGSSPLLERSRSQVEALGRALGPDRYRCYLGMRHWSPWIEETVGAMAEDGITRAVGIVLAPHYNAWNNGRYVEKIEAGLRMHGASIDFTIVRSYHDAPGLIDALARRVGDGLARWPSADRGRVHVLFCAHSVPVRVAPPDDPYAAQLRETAALAARAAGVPEERWSWAWISAGRSPEPWLGPSILERLPGLAASGVRDIVCVPVGFVSDHVEVLYDLDIEAADKARELGVRFERPASLNDDPSFIEALAGAVRAAAGEAGENASRGESGRNASLEAAGPNASLGEAGRNAAQEATR